MLFPTVSEKDILGWIHECAHQENVVKGGHGSLRGILFLTTPEDPEGLSYLTFSILHQGHQGTLVLGTREMEEPLAYFVCLLSGSPPPEECSQLLVESLVHNPHLPRPQGFVEGGEVEWEFQSSSVS